MADKMMRMAGRGTDGTAKPVKTDNQGNVMIQKNSHSTETETLYEGIAPPGFNNKYFSSVGYIADEMYLLIQTDEPDWRVTVDRGNEDRAERIDAVYPHLPPPDKDNGYIDEVYTQAPLRMLFCLPPEGAESAEWNSINDRYEYPDFDAALKNKSSFHGIGVRLRRKGSAQKDANIKISILRKWR